MAAIPIDYIEIPVRDVAAAKRFYGQAFGWTFEDYGPDYAAFTHGAGNGGFVKTEEIRLGGPLLVLYSKELPALQQAIREAGGIITQDTYEFPGGRRFHFTDPTGHELAVWSE
jgi:predicted enzyme related to lactoylglutathione lyase